MKTSIINILFLLSMLSLAGVLFINYNGLVTQGNYKNNGDYKKDDATYLESKCSNLLEEYEPVYDGEIAAVDFGSYPGTERYFTVITDSVSEGVNFRGHYTIAHWGCGTDCVGYAVVDVIDGKIIEYNIGTEGTHLFFNEGGKYFMVDTVYSGSEKNYYTVNESGEVVIACTEIAEQDM